MSRQRGASGAFILAILAFIMVGLLALGALRRMSTSITDRETTTARLARAADLLDAFAGSAAQLPCPANPALPDTDANAGVADPNGPTTNCNSSSGTLPWRTIGLALADSYDAWGRRISYRVYSGNTGLTQAGGASMVNCDTVEAFPIGAVPANGLCPNTYDMTPSQFYAGKGLQVTDMGVVHPDAAYVLVSHGPSGMGGYTSTGAQMDMPVGDELNNTRDTGPFTIRAFSDPDTAVNTAQHFDDLLAYRSIADLAKRANLAARNWPDDITAAVTFDRPTLTAALGSSPASDTGTSQIAFSTATVSAFDSGGAQDISFISGATESIGGVSGGGNDLASTGGEGLRIDLLDSTSTQFAFTLNNFGYQSSILGIPIAWEDAELKFYSVSGNTATLISTVDKFGCNPDGGLASFLVDVGATFSRVEIRPKPTVFFGGTASSFSLAEIRACAAGVTPCATGLATPANTCP